MREELGNGDDLGQASRSVEIAIDFFTMHAWVCGVPILAQSSIIPVQDPFCSLHDLRALALPCPVCPVPASATLHLSSLLYLLPPWQVPNLSLPPLVPACARGPPPTNHQAPIINQQHQMQTHFLPPRRSLHTCSLTSAPIAVRQP